MIKMIIYIALIFTLFSCNDFAIKKNIVGNYYLIATDAVDALNLSYHEPGDGDSYGTIIDATVFAVGFNDKYIIAKQYPRIFPNPPDKKTTNYYILPLKKGMDWKSKNGLIGPLTLEQFNVKRKELNIPNEVIFKNATEFSK